jgi:hypothetical protein
MTTNTSNHTTITLSDDQANAEKAYVAFLTTSVNDPGGRAMIISGYAGTGKSTLVKHLLDNTHLYAKTIQLLNPSYSSPRVVLTATTNKAAQALWEATGRAVFTIHSTLGLRVNTDYRTNTTSLSRSKRSHFLDKEIPPDALIVIDEASFVDSALLKEIFQLLPTQKIVFIGDPAQLTPVKSSGIPPVFKCGFPTVKLTKVVRQMEGNPIIELASNFRNTVETGQFFQFKPDNVHIKVLSKEDFNQEILNDFNQPDWNPSTSRVLSWTNKTAIHYGALVTEYLTGSYSIKVGDRLNVNSAVMNGKFRLKTDEIVEVLKVVPDSERGVDGDWVWVADSGGNNSSVFVPHNHTHRKALEKVLREAGDFDAIRDIDETWADLRPIYSSTINKAQGSTYDRVFIDLNDISKCTSGDQLARLMYVAVSRARYQVFLTGDLC